ncbi:unnamed protein product [Hymenolepis diminuta]|uniref:Uncharacterized protein n=1 Tax=Hymenolepis diminuta TaxID=6216 RepID=A0A564XZ53_HYMDI|nr:unnamed protein product [Hymenolepis diminuta]
MMKMLLNRGAAVHAMDSDCDSAIHISATRGHLEGIKLLMSEGSLANIGNIYLATPLMLASTEGYYSIVDYLLKNGVTMQYQVNKNRESELTLACCSGHFDIVKLLLDAADPSRDRKEEINYAILNAMISENASIVRLLLEHEADPNFSDPNYSQPIFSAIRGNNLEILNLLIAYEADVNARDIDGYTPLMTAVMVENETIVSRLIEAGADVHAENEESNETVLSLAEERPNKVIIETIRNAMKSSL